MKIRKSIFSVIFLSIMLISTSDAKTANCGGAPVGAVQVRTKYKNSSVSCGKVCEFEKQSRTCTRLGTWSPWSGSLLYGFDSCIAPQASACSCDGVPHLGSQQRVMSQNSVVNCTANCVSETQSRVCNAGTWGAWSGTYANAVCSKPSADICSIERDAASLKLSKVPGRYTDITYCKVKSTGLLLKLDYQIPVKPKRSPLPVVVITHGGGLIQGDKSEKGISMMVNSMADAGYFVANINYRLAGPVQEDSSPSEAYYQVNAQLTDAIQDTSCAFRWVRGLSRYFNLDTNRIVASGESGGSYLALMAALAGDKAEFKGNSDLFASFSGLSSAANGVVEQFGFANLVTHYNFQEETREVNNIENIMRSTPTSNPSGYSNLSPINYVRATSPPIGVIHGTRDSFVSFSQAIELREKARATGARFDLYTIEGADHGWLTFDYSRPGCRDMDAYKIMFPDLYPHGSLCLDVTKTALNGANALAAAVAYMAKYFSR